ncbi:MarR family transcriptional regulator [Vreelandella glaciei]|uniref:MarR family winged helix-turn-helix transcriptional regulator n=1 Tax=Vreelandella glaciei TaxID=186761 RepID=UPI0030034A62
MRQGGSEATIENVGSKWRRHNIGRLLNDSIGHFERRVLQLMADAGYLEARMTHISLTRNLGLEGARLTELARRASMTKQSMAQLVNQLEKLDMVERRSDPKDGRARIIVFTAKGVAWLEAFREAVHTAEQEMEEAIGSENLQLIKRCLTEYKALDTVTPEISLD